MTKVTMMAVPVYIRDVGYFAKIHVIADERQKAIARAQKHVREATQFNDIDLVAAVQQANSDEWIVELRVEEKNG